MTSNLLENVQIYLLPQADSRIRDIVLIFLAAVYIFKDGGRERQQIVSTLSIAKYGLFIYIQRQS